MTQFYRFFAVMLMMLSLTALRVHGQSSDTALNKSITVFSWDKKWVSRELASDLERVLQRDKIWLHHVKIPRGKGASDTLDTVMTITWGYNLVVSCAVNDTTSGWNNSTPTLVAVSLSLFEDRCELFLKDLNGKRRDVAYGVLRNVIVGIVPYEDLNENAPNRGILIEGYKAWAEGVIKYDINKMWYEDGTAK